MFFLIAEAPRFVKRYISVAVHEHGPSPPEALNNVLRNYIERSAPSLA